MNDASLGIESSPEPSSLHGLNIDTCKGSLLHILTRAPGPGGKLTWLSRVATYLLSAFVLGVIPIGTALATQKVWWTGNQSNNEMAFPVLNDYNCIWVWFVTLPLLITFLRSERTLIPQRILSIHAAGVLRPKRDLDRACWEHRFKLANIWAQLAGLCISAIFACVVYRQWMETPVDSWLLDKQGNIHITGWMFLFSFVGLFWSICTLYVARAAVTLWLLWSVVAVSEVLPRPFHPDRAGGLSEVAKIGLRNQYILAAIGVQLVCAASVTSTLVKAAPTSRAFLIAGLVAGAVAYVILGPFVFISPLMPFRKSMRAKKLDSLRKIGDGLQRLTDSIVNQLPTKSPTAEQQTEIERYNSLMELVEREPVWPFDTVTLRRFLSAYLAPVIVWLLALSPISKAIAELLYKILGIHVSS